MSRYPRSLATAIALATLFVLGASRADADPPGEVCNYNGVCESWERFCVDCEPGLPACGDSVCNGDEDCQSCVLDCGTCPEDCNLDGFCNEQQGEGCESCRPDCDPPPAFFASTYIATIGQAITFTGIDMEDPAPSWDLGNNEHIVGNPLSYAYWEEGEQRVRLTAADSRCNTVQTSDWQSLFVRSAFCNGNSHCESYLGESCSECPSDCGVCPAGCNFNYSCEPENGETCATCPADCDREPYFEASTYVATAGDPITFYAYRVDDEAPIWDFGNEVQQNGASPHTYVYPEAGLFSATLTGSDHACQTTQTSVPLDIRILAPPCNHDNFCDASAGENCSTCVADCAADLLIESSHEIAQVGEQVQFAILNPGEFESTPAVDWRPGDGSTSSSHSFVQNHAYSEPRTYHARATATDRVCGARVESHYVRVRVRDQVSVQGDAALVEDSLLPVSMCQGTPFSAWVRMKNIGTTTWSAEAGYKLGSIGDLTGFSSFIRVELPAGVEVRPSESFTFHFVLDRVPADDLEYLGWRMVREHVQWFGGSAETFVDVPEACGGGGGGGGQAKYTCLANIQDEYGLPVQKPVTLKIFSFDGNDYHELGRVTESTNSEAGFARLEISSSEDVYEIHCQSPIKNGTGTTFYVRRTEPIPPGTVVEIAPVYVPLAKATLPVAGLKGQDAKMRLYKSGPYDHVVVLAEPFNPAERAPGQAPRSEDASGGALWAAYRAVMVALYSKGYDVWLVNTSRTGQNFHEQAAELAEAIGKAVAWGPGANEGKVIVSGYSGAGVTARIATATWEADEAHGGWTEGERQRLGISGPLPVSLVAFGDSPLRGAQANADLLTFLVNKSRAAAFNMDSCGFQQLVNDNPYGSTGCLVPQPNGACNHDAFFRGFDLGTVPRFPVKFPFMGNCDGHVEGGICVCDAGPPVEKINGNGFANAVRKVAFTDGRCSETARCYGDERDFNADGADLCADHGGGFPFVPHAGNVFADISVENCPFGLGDIQFATRAADLVPGSRQSAFFGNVHEDIRPSGDNAWYHNLALVLFGACNAADFQQYFATTFIPVSSALATDGCGCGPFDACHESPYVAAHGASPPANICWLFDQFSSVSGLDNPCTPSAVMTIATDGLTGELDGSGSESASGAIQQFAWDLGDGTVVTGEQVEHEYEWPGVYPVRLTVRAEGEVVGRSSRVLRIGLPPNVPPHPILGGATTGFPGVPIQFEGAESYDEDGEVVEYSWSFGDDRFSDEPEPVHVFAAPGVYAVHLAVTDELGEQSIRRIDVTITDPELEAPAAIAPRACSPTSSPQFRWSEVPGANRYWLSITEAGSAAPVLQESALVNTTFTPASALPVGRSLRWKVRACNATKCGSWSESVHFTVGCGAASAPEPIAPQGCIDTPRPFLSWSALPGSSSYQVALYRVGTALPEFEATVGGTSVRVPGPVAPWIEYRFRVRASTSAGFGPWSRDQHFSFDCMPEWPGTAVPLAPAGTGLGTGLPLFEWRRALSATDYLVEVVDSFGIARIGGWYSAGTVCGDAGCEASLPMALPQGTYSWRVRTRNSAGLGPWSSMLVFSLVPQGTSPWESVAVADFDRDGRNDVLWQHVESRDLQVWHMNESGPATLANISPANAGDPNWRVAGAGDFDADGDPDLLWQHVVTSVLRVWLMDGVDRVESTSTYPDRPAGEAASWKVAEVSDYNDDGKPDLLWQHQSEGWLIVWTLDGLAKTGTLSPSPNRPSSDFGSWKVRATAKLAAGRTSKLQWIWQHVLDGWLVAWTMDGVVRSSVPAMVPNRPESEPSNWVLAGAGDFTGDGAADLLFRNRQTGANEIWVMNGTTRTAVVPLESH